MKRALRGQVVTMDARHRVLGDGVVWIDGARVAAVTAWGQPAPAGFGAVRAVNTSATLFPGLIELHNHLAYDVLPLWSVDRRYGNRDQWQRRPSYRAQVTAPMSVLGASPTLLPALIRYVECKCLLAGTTTSQGISIFSNTGARRHFRGLIRNVEATYAADLPDAAARVADVSADDAAKFGQRLDKETCVLLHLAEGTDAAARKHFLALEHDEAWAIGPSLAGIHGVALTDADLALYAEHGGALVWSPTSNLLLYGATARIEAARAAGVRVALGSDWSYSGSKNLLHELKIARAVAAGAISDRDLVKMATRGAAEILGWQGALGSLAAGRRADLLALEGTGPDPYGRLLEADESDITLVMIDGVPRAGTPSMLERLRVVITERCAVGGETRALALTEEDADPDVARVSLAEAEQTLRAALAELPTRARDLERQPSPIAALRSDGPRWFLALDDHPEPPMLRASEATRAFFARDASAVTAPMTLDPLTVVSDEGYWAALAAQRNLPAAVKDALGVEPTP